MGEGIAWLRWGRVVLYVVAGVGVFVYLAVFALLLAFQRDLLFVALRHAEPLAADSIYRAGPVREHDGTRLTVWRSAPAHAGKGTLVFFYGNGGTLSDFADVGSCFHSEGYGVVLASYRGYDGNPGNPSEDGVLADARAILSTIPKGDGPVILWGQSLGTGVAAHMAAERRGRLLILQSPYTAIVDVAALRFPLYPVRWFMRDRFDTVALVPRIGVPVLIIHGTADAIVPFTMGQSLAHDFGRRARFVAVPGGGHNDLSSDVLCPIAEEWLSAQTRQASIRTVLQSAH
jgi:pimeloyl-ACP methyl ester carboxylesterase